MFENKIESKQNMQEKKSGSLIPEDELEINFVRSSGKGGQNVNKLSTKAQLRWNIDKSLAFSDEEKEKIKFSLANRINKEGELLLESQEERSQLQNKQRVVERLNNLIKTALAPQQERIATKPTYGSKERRLEEKKMQGKKKKERSWQSNHE